MSRVLPAKVRKQGPSHIVATRATHFWFPLHDIKFGWGLIHADVQKKTLTVWGRTPAHLSQRAQQWMQCWLGERVIGEEQLEPWTTVRVEEEWSLDSDLQAALAMAQCISLDQGAWVAEELQERAARLLPEVCREYGRDQDRRQVHSEDTAPPQPTQLPAKPTKGARPKPRPEGTQRHMVWQQIRAEAMRQKKRRQAHDEGEVQHKDWKAKWRVDAAVSSATDY